MAADAQLAKGVLIYLLIFTALHLCRVVNVNVNVNRGFI